MIETLDEAIKHCEEEAKKQRIIAKNTTYSDTYIADCLECAEEHEQLAEWLKELRDYREGKRTCENCRHQDKSESEYPCSICRCNHPNKFEWKAESKPKMSGKERFCSDVLCNQNHGGWCTSECPKKCDTKEEET